MSGYLNGSAPSSANLNYAISWCRKHLQIDHENGDQLDVHCPWPEHDDSNRSASVNISRRVVNCHGCGRSGTLTEVAKANGWDAPAWEPEHQGAGSGGRGGGKGRLASIDATYEYQDADCRTVLRVLRGREQSGARGLRQAYPAGKPTAKGALYNLPAVLAAVAAGKPVCVAEGEPDCDTLKRLGFVATCSAMGAGKFTRAHAKQFPSGAEVFVFFDADTPGLRHAAKVGRYLVERGCTVKVVPLGYEVTAKGGRDVTDWEREPGIDGKERGADELRGLLANAVPYDKWTYTESDPEAPKVRPTSKDNPFDIAEATYRIAPDMRRSFMYVYGRGWFRRDSEAGAWTPDADGAALDFVHNHPVWWECSRGMRAATLLAELSIPCTVRSAELDSNDWEAGLPGGAGVLDIRTGKVRPVAPDDRITMALGCVPEPGEPTALLTTMASTFGDLENPWEVINYLRWWARRALTGDCSAESMVFLYGPPGSGKSTFADTLLYIAGSYGCTVAAEHITGESHQHRQWLARIDRKRFVRVNEMPPGGKWRTSDLLSIISGETLNANRMRQDGFDFRSRAHVCATGNHAPSAHSNSGYWRRLRLVDCRHVIPRDKQDTELKAKLRAEAGRILSWILEAPNDEPPVPTEMIAAADNLRSEQNDTGSWIESNYWADRNGRTEGQEIYDSYCAQFGVQEQVTKRTFDMMLTERFGPAFNARNNSGKVVKHRRCRIADVPGVPE